MGLIHKIRLTIAAMVHRQGQYLRGQVYELIVTLMIIAVAMILFVAGLIAGGVTLYLALRRVVPPAGAMGIITAILLALAVILGVLGHQLQLAGIGKRKSHHHDDADHDAEHSSWGKEYAAVPPLTPSQKQARTTAGQTFDEVQERLEQPLEMVKRYPLASMGVALGLGMVLGRSKAARSAMKSTLKIGGKILLDHYLKGR